MKVLKVGNIWEGDSHADMINQVLGTDYKSYMKCYVPLAPINGIKTIAWFVYMDGSVHGHTVDYLWVNNLSKDGKEIVERCVSTDKSYVQKVAENKQNVVAFQLDPHNTGKRADKYKCKFVGVFEQQCYDRKNLERVYKRISDTYVLENE